MILFFWILGCFGYSLGATAACAYWVETFESHWSPSKKEPTNGELFLVVLLMACWPLSPILAGAGKAMKHFYRAVSKLYSLANKLGVRLSKIGS